MTDGGAGDPLRELGRRLDKARRAQPGQASRSAAAQAAGSGLAFAWRIGIELVVAISVATAIGWALDRWLGTRPWAMIVLFFLGVAAGMINVWRTVTGMGAAMGYRRPGAAGEAPDRWDDDEDED